MGKNFNIYLPASPTQRYKGEDRMKITVEDSLFAKYIKLKIGAVYQEDDNGKNFLFGNCEHCGQWKVLECSHLHSRVRKTTRFDEENVAALCGGCHKYLGEHPPAHTSFFKQRLGSDRLEKLEIRSNMTIKDLPYDKKELRKDLKAKIRRLEGEY